MLEAPPEKKLPILKITVALIVLAVVGILILRGVDLRGLVKQGMELIRDAGPVAFFTALVVLPAMGMPVLAFTLTAGPAFAEQLGLPIVLLLVLACVTANMVLTYALAR